MEFSATFCFFNDWTNALNEIKLDSDGWLWFNGISSQKKFFYKAIFKRINANNSTLKNQCYRITGFSKNECYSFIHSWFCSASTRSAQVFLSLIQWCYSLMMGIQFIDWGRWNKSEYMPTFFYDFIFACRSGISRQSFWYFFLSFPMLGTFVYCSYYVYSMFD